jgi:hypothetical protein
MQIFVKEQYDAPVLANLGVYNPVDKVVDNSRLRQKTCG